MDSHLATTGTASLLEQLSSHIPDDFINAVGRRGQRAGPRPLYGPAQLFRVHLLALLTSSHSFNLLVELLKENRAWRRFAFLSHRHQVPDAKMLCHFRDQLGVQGLRAINTHLLAGLLESCQPERKTVTIIDSTDLPAATNAYKKSGMAVIRQPGRRSVGGRASTAIVVGLLVTKNTRSGCGSMLMSEAFS